LIAWAKHNGENIGTVLRTSDWAKPLGIIAEQTRSGGFKARAAHAKTPDAFNVVMQMTLEEYRYFIYWYEEIDRRGVYTFAYPKIDDNSGELVEYAFAENSEMNVNNISGDIVEVKMAWRKA
jgi:hypothetical protein